MLLDILYLLLHVVALPWLLWRRWRLGKNRRGFWQKYSGSLPQQPTDRPLVWLHAVSVGEVNLLAPMIEALQQQWPAARCLVSTTTETGFDQAVRKYGGDRVCFFPFDFSWAVRRALSRIQPQVLVLAELELWPNLLAACQRRSIPVVVINARMSDRSHARYRRLGGWIGRRIFGRLTLVAAQGEEYRRRFVELGVPAERVITTGNLKFDGAKTERDAAFVREHAARTGWGGEGLMFVAGSTQPEEEGMVLNAWSRLQVRFPGLALVLVPRHPHHADTLCRQLEMAGRAFVRRSAGGTWQKGETSEGPAEKRTTPEVLPIMVVDVIGELPAWWGLATVGFVGGSFGSRGGQSMIEPAAMGVPVCFGPNTSNFRDVSSALLTAGAAAEIRNEDEMEQFLRAMLEDESLRSATGARARELVLAGRGSAARTASLLGPWLSRRTGHDATQR